MSGAWIVAYVALWLAVLALAAACVVLLRHGRELEQLVRGPGASPAAAVRTGVRVAPMADLFDYSAASLTVLAFTKPDCTICRAIEPDLDTLPERIPGVRVEVVSLGPRTSSIYEAFSVRDTPYVVGVDAGGLIRAAGGVRTIADVDALAQRALASQPLSS